ncbi:class I SAM-dependent methyltransferase [Bosea rubneri]|uniref:Class I SAM-dependent methyltransferase n=1 Tax=Bosea rubneri TaxID=3075434 RepID=A0ABU3SGZ2_9HYPH|nr:class I SAM-dependent methyltransferase [Bosea sp. ZW T0_25]MDU0343984.1 class I SAM-dependent methyltransferase [Bosea sp. ZW T0_25]
MTLMSRTYFPFSSAALRTPRWLEHSAWVEHSPFSFWLVSWLRPRSIVELGVHTGYSYLTFCQAASSLEGKCSVFGVDTWEGDEHAGFYNSAVYDTLRSYVNENYPSFGSLIKSKFSDAVQNFQDETIDLIHFDGHHSFESVSEDWSEWRSKLSKNSVVLFHDTNVYDRDFGVYKLWNSLSSDYPSLAFPHGYGLGVLFYGETASQRWKEEFSHLGAGDWNGLLQLYARLGRGLSLQLQIRDVQRSAETEVQQARQEFARDLEAQRGALTDEARAVFADKLTAIESDYQSALAEGSDKLTALENAHQNALSKNTAKLAAMEGAYQSALVNNTADLRAKLHEATAELEAMRSSASWRMTSSYRSIGSAIKSIMKSSTK